MSSMQGELCTSNNKALFTAYIQLQPLLKVSQMIRRYFEKPDI